MFLLFYAARMPVDTPAHTLTSLTLAGLTTNVLSPNLCANLGIVPQPLRTDEPPTDPPTGFVFLRGVTLASSVQV